MSFITSFSRLISRDNQKKSISYISAIIPSKKTLPAANTAKKQPAVKRAKINGGTILSAEIQETQQETPPAETQEIPPPAETVQGRDYFLSCLADCADIRQAVKKSGIANSAIHYLLANDKDFSARLDEIINKKLEFAAIDTALGGNSSLLGLLLTNRMPAKYKPKSSVQEQVSYPRVIYVDSDNCQQEQG